MRLIYYAVALTQDGKYARQWSQSIRSLRRFNSHIGVRLFVFNDLSESLTREAAYWRVDIKRLGGYETWMSDRAHPHAGLLAFYPTLHKFLVLGETDMSAYSQVLYVDCDTYFFHDPELLFDRCRCSHWYAREIPGSRLSSSGITSNINERLISEIVKHEGLGETQTLNAGLCLLNHGIWTNFLDGEAVFLDFAWRLIVGMVGLVGSPFDPRGWRSPTTKMRSGSEGHLSRLTSLVLKDAAEKDFDKALPYPSDNWWILDEIAIVFTLGTVTGLTQTVLTKESVMQGNEFLPSNSENFVDPIVAHYFSTFESEFFSRFSRISL